MPYAWALHIMLYVIVAYELLKYYKYLVVFVYLALPCLFVY